MQEIQSEKNITEGLGFGFSTLEQFTTPSPDPFGLPVSRHGRPKTRIQTVQRLRVARLCSPGHGIGEYGRVGFCPSYVTS